ncbi:MAG: transposase [Saprospiraceae bacterium]|nr:transposase [Saprospiraceae bacterium]
MINKMTTEERRRRRFTESFRKEQVELIESGQATIAEVGRRYEVKADNIGKWVKKYGSRKPEGGVTLVGSQRDFDRLAFLEKDYKSLQVLFGEQQIHLIRLRKLLDLAKGELGEDFEKKVGFHY